MSDIDVAVLVHDISSGRFIRRAIEEKIFIFPIDLTIKMSSEELYLDFLSGSDACEI